MNWPKAVKFVMWKKSQEKCSRTIEYCELIKSELATIIELTGSKGKTPERTLSRTLQDLRDDGYLKFVDYKGTYFLEDKLIDEFRTW